MGKFNRFTGYIEGNGALANTMYSFWPHLSAQDILLQPNEQVIDNLSTNQKRAILALDVKGAFDSMSHTTALQKLLDTNHKAKMHGHVRSFLTGRTTSISVVHLKTEKINVLEKGTLWGAILFPILFNFTMKELLKRLRSKSGIQHALYADDITIWTDSNLSPRQQQDTSQEVIDVTTQYPGKCNLQCSPEKLELLIMRARTRGRPPKEMPEPGHMPQAQPIPKVLVLKSPGSHDSKRRSRHDDNKSAQQKLVAGHSPHQKDHK